MAVLETTNCTGLTLWARLPPTSSVTHLTSLKALAAGRQASSTDRTVEGSSGRKLDHGDIITLGGLTVARMNIDIGGAKSLPCAFCYVEIMSTSKDGKTAEALATENEIRSIIIVILCAR